MEAKTTTEVLLQALPYIQRFRGKVVVVKYGGNAMVDAELATQFAEDIVLMHQVGIKPVVVHGGGPQITELHGRLGKATEFKDGQRVTDAESLEITRMVLVGKVNRELVGLINRHGPHAVGISGEDAGLLLATKRHPELGFVGDVEAVNARIVEKLLAEDLIPVISTTGSDATGQSYNINADAVAGALAATLQAEKVVYLTNVEGLQRDREDPTSLISRLSASQLDELVQSGAVGTGMIPKAAGCIHAVDHGVTSAHMINGTIPHVLLVELFTDAGIGTMITKGDPS
ncbi:MAG: acetylglutamate kinase [Acidimicrobiia bacterium]|nr:acetylglutamate kinase [Acidimicrobiia bacterium]NNF10718.1 acetylglutamate kinase [Acidimicrobiia bacterium]NNL71562.1 acetylglutamate kinase [Acidimicrobiia bacterium]